MTLVACAAFAFDPASQDDSQALVRHFRKDGELAEPFPGGKFSPRPGERIYLMGGADIYRLQEDVRAERALHLAFPDRKLRVRNLAWPADTAYRQQRPMFFYTGEKDGREGSVPDLREKLAPGVFLLRFGKMESLDGLERLSAFEAVYGRLVEALGACSARLVLVGPEEFSDQGPAGHLAEERNRVLAEYRGAVERIAAESGALFWPTLGEGLAALGTESESEAAGTAEADSLTKALRRKNQLWDQYYRPTNWAFLFGDRQWVPSSRDHRDSERRWFVEELMQLPGMVDEADRVVWKEAEAWAKDRKKEAAK